jgi:hypothetical protein
MNKEFEKRKGRLTTEEAREIGRKGGKASVEARREKKKLRQLVEAFGEMPAPEKVRKVLNELGVAENEMRTNDMAIVVGLYQKAIKGDVSAFNAIRDIRGEKPVDETKLMGKLDSRIEIGFVDADVSPSSSEEDVDV